MKFYIIINTYDMRQWCTPNSLHEQSDLLLSDFIFIGFLFSAFIR